MKSFKFLPLYDEQYTSWINVIGMHKILYKSIIFDELRKSI